MGKGNQAAEKVRNARKKALSDERFRKRLLDLIHDKIKKDSDKIDLSVMALFMKDSFNEYSRQRDSDLERLVFDSLTEMFREKTPLLPNLKLDSFTKAQILYGFGHTGSDSEEDAYP